MFTNGPTFRERNEKEYEREQDKDVFDCRIDIVEEKRCNFANEI